MDLNKKKVLFIPFEELTQKDVSKVSKGILDKVNALNIQRVAIIIDDTADKFLAAYYKSTEFFVFAYCKTAVSLHKRCDDIIGEVTALMPHNLKKKDLMVSVGEKIEGIDYISVEDFV